MAPMMATASDTDDSCCTPIYTPPTTDSDEGSTSDNSSLMDSFEDASGYWAPPNSPASQIRKPCLTAIVDVSESDTVAGALERGRRRVRQWCSARTRTASSGSTRSAASLSPDDEAERLVTWHRTLSWTPPSPRREPAPAVAILSRRRAVVPRSAAARKCVKQTEHSDSLETASRTPVNRDLYRTRESRTPEAPHTFSLLHGFRSRQPRSPTMMTPDAIIGEERQYWANNQAGRLINWNRPMPGASYPSLRRSQGRRRAPRTKVDQYDQPDWRQMGGGV